MDTCMFVCCFYSFKYKKVWKTAFLNRLNFWDSKCNRKEQIQVKDLLDLLTGY